MFIELIELGYSSLLANIDPITLEMELNDRLLNQGVAVNPCVGILVQTPVEYVEELFSLIVGNVFELPIHNAFHDGLYVFTLERTS